jgi:hypothetical protein
MRRSRFFARSLLCLLLAVLVLGLAPGWAATASKTPAAKNTTQTQDLSNAVTQSYNADTSVQLGMIVKLKDKASKTVTPVSTDEIANMLGVVIPSDDATIVLTPQTTTSQQVLVATSGRFSVLVSNQNGPIKTGDFITVSSVAGIGMKADENQLEVIGKAASDFSGNANVIGTVKLKDSLGRTNSVALGRVQLDMRITHNPLFQKSADYVPGFLAKAATAVANKPVSVARIYLGMALLFVSSIIAGDMLYSGIRSGMIAVGRNPLSKKSIMRSLVETVIAGLIVFAVGIFAVYLLLKL